MSLIQDDPDIARWIRKITLRGITYPLHPFGVRQPDNAEEDHDNWLYPFPLGFGMPLPNVRILDLRQFANVSRRPEDCKAFARWIDGLATLTSVEKMTFYNCEMSSNSAIALTRAFPRLSDLTFHGVDFTRPNIGALVDMLPKPTGSDSTDNSPNTEAQESSKIGRAHV